MRREILYSALCTAFVAVTLIACNDYDAAQTAYEDTTDTGVEAVSYTHLTLPTT